MIFLKPALAALAALAVAMSLSSATLRAQPLPSVDKASAEAPCKPAPPPNRAPSKRRSVQQIIEPTPPIVTEGYRPTLVVRPPAPLPAQPQPQPQTPVRLNSCDRGGCTDTSGARYNGGIGNTLIGPQGQLCTRGAVNAQCF